MTTASKLTDGDAADSAATPLTLGAATPLTLASEDKANGDDSAAKVAVVATKEGDAEGGEGAGAHAVTEVVAADAGEHDELDADVLQWNKNAEGLIHPDEPVLVGE